MPKYEVRLESPTDSQFRLIAVEAADDNAARQQAERVEHKHTSFSLLPPEKTVWEAPYRGDGGDARVDLSLWDQYDPIFAKQTAQHGSYKEAVRAGERRVDDWLSRVQFDNNGRVRASGLGGRSLARLVAHLQQEPYEIVDVREVTDHEADAAAEGFAGAQRMLEIAKRYEQNPPAGINPATWIKVQEALREGGLPLNAVTALLYGLPWQKQIDGSSTTVFSSATVKMALLTGYTVDQDAHDFFNDVSATEITGTGYTAGGYTFAAKTTNYTSATDQIWLDNTTDPSWTTSTLSATDAVVWVDTAGASSTDPVYGAIDFGATVSTTAGTFTVALDAVGWANFDLT